MQSKTYLAFHSAPLKLIVLSETCTMTAMNDESANEEIEVRSQTVFKRSGQPLLPFRKANEFLMISFVDL
jgi:hypothetical protein